MSRKQIIAAVSVVWFVFITFSTVDSRSRAFANPAAKVAAARPSAQPKSLRATIAQLYPKLHGHFQILKPATDRYNCIAWSLGITSKWVWPGNSLNNFDELNSHFGYRRIAKLDYRLQKGVDKIVLYGKWENGKLKVTHQARQMRNGTWSSKLGKLPLIRHATPDGIDNATYGKPIAVYVRQHESTRQQARTAPPRTRGSI